MAKKSKIKHTKKLLKRTDRAICESVILSVITYSLTTYLRDMGVLTDVQFISDLKGCEIESYSKDIQYVIIQGRKVSGALKYMDDLYIQVGLKTGDRLLADIEKEAGLKPFELAYSNYIFGLCLLNLYLEFFHKPTFSINVKFSECVEAYDLALEAGFKNKDDMVNVMNDTVLSVYFYDRVLNLHNDLKLSDYLELSKIRKERLRGCLQK